jgi:diguanylate cyclase (GGDEF)-like protein
VDFESRGSLTDTDTIWRWTYKLPRPLERRFEKETDARRNRQIRVWAAAGLAFSWLNFAADVVTIPDVWWLALLLRLCVVTPVTLLAMRQLAAAETRWWRTMLASAAPPCASLLAVLVGFGASSSVDTFRSALVLLLGILWMNVLIPMRFRDALVFTLVTLSLGDSINIGAASLHHAAIGHPEVIVTTHVLVGLSLLARYLAERESRRSFVLGLRLQIRAEDLARSNAKLLEMSNTDPLTGLANRRFFDLTLARTWESAAVARASVAVMMIDVDHFKLFNDTAGHLEGDRCLSIVARTIAGQTRGGLDLAARFGGEEFVVLMPATGYLEALEIAERVRAAIAALQVFHPGQIGRGFVSVSIGVAAMRPASLGDEPRTLLAAADAAMYAAKDAGRDRVMQARRSTLDAAV